MQNAERMGFVNDESWTILNGVEKSIKEKIERIGIPLKQWGVSINRGILTGFNDAFIISSEKRDELIKKDPKSDDLIRPILRGRDIKRYGYTFANLWVINTHNGIKERGLPRIDINEYPAIKEHLDEYYPKLVKRADKGDTPYNLRNCAYMDDFNKQKICWIELTDESKFSFSDDGIYLLNTVFFMVGDHIKYLLAALNSRIIHWYFLTCTGTTSGVGTNRWLKYTVETIPIPMPSEAQIQRIEELVDAVLSAKRNKEDTKALEDEIDQQIIMAYGLTAKERDFVFSCP